MRCIKSTSSALAEFDKQIEKQLQQYEAKCNEGVIETKKEY